MKTNLEYLPKELHSAMHHLCTLDRKANHYHSQRDFYKISGIVKYSCMNLVKKHCWVTAVLELSADLMLSSYLLWFCYHSTSFEQIMLVDTIQTWGKKEWNSVQSPLRFPRSWEQQEVWSTYKLCLEVYISLIFSWHCSRYKSLNMYM